MSSCDYPTQRGGSIDYCGMFCVQRTDSGENRSLPTRYYVPERTVVRPPLHRVPLPFAGVSGRSLVPDFVSPGLSDRCVACHDLRRPQVESNQLRGIIEVQDSERVGKGERSQRPPRSRYQRKLEHRVIPGRKVSEDFPTRCFRISRDVPDVVVGMVDTSATLRSVFVERMARLAWLGGVQIREDAIDEHSGCSAPHLAVQSVQNSRGAVYAKRVQRAGPAEI